MNISAMADDWRKEEFFERKKTYSTSLRNGTYNQDNVQAFLKSVKAGNGKALAGRLNGIPKGSVYHVARCLGI